MAPSRCWFRVDLEEHGLLHLLAPPAFAPPLHQVKPVSPGAPWRRLRLDSEGTVTLRSRKLQWWLLTLDLEGHANPLRRTSNLSFRCGDVMVLPFRISFGGHREGLMTRVPSMALLTSSYD